MKKNDIEKIKLKIKLYKNKKIKWKKNKMRK